MISNKNYTAFLYSKSLSNHLCCQSSIINVIINVKGCNNENIEINERNYIGKSK